MDLREEMTPPARPEIVTGRRGHPSVRVRGENGNETLLHSLYDPFREAALQVPSAVDAETLVFLGTGLGFHIPLVLEKGPGVKRVVLVERYPELAAAAAARIAEGCVRVHIVTCASLLADEAPLLPAGLDGERLQIVPHPPSVGANPSWYARWHAAIAAHGLPRRERSEEKGGGGARTVLALFGGYYGERECIRGLEALGHRVCTVDYREGEGESCERFRRALREERPDLVLSVNMRGLDSRGVMGEVLARLGIPLALWFVDSPEFILRSGPLPPPEVTEVFLWDRSYVGGVSGLGYRTHFLPLAADLSLEAAAKPADRFRAGISFVGNSLVTGFLARVAAKLPPSAAANGLMERAVAEVLENRGAQLAVLDRFLATEGRELPDNDGRLFFRAFALHSATTRYRTMLLERLVPAGLSFFGDPDGWRALFGAGITAFPDVHYFAETPAVYASTEVNFNATSLQMPKTVNQRVFDVPLCGGFLLTDRQEALSELFAEDEVAVYEGTEDVAEKAAYYLARPLLRLEIAARARKRVLGEHTYQRRMNELLAAI